MSGGQRRRDYAIFVSSTSRDLAEDYRPAVRRALQTLRQHPIMMEDFGAQNGDGSSVSTDEVARADLVLMVVAWRYGYVPAGETRSITHLEFLEAVRLGKPRLVFLAAPETEARDDLFPHDQRDPEHHAQLLAFRAELGRDRAVAYFSTPDELERAVYRAVSGWLQEHGVRVFPRTAPPPVRDFVGREEVAAQLMTTLRGGTSAAISALVAGMGGVGKSALAGEVLRRLAADPTAFPGGIALVRCNDQEGLPGLAWIYDQLLTEWGVPLSLAEVAATQDDPGAAADFRERALRTRLGLADDSGLLPALVLLDNVEEGLRLERALAALGQAGLTTLVTARHLPSIPGMRVERLDVLDPDPAAALFGARYREAGGQWDDRRDAEPTRRIVALLGGLPLAIELAAADAARDEGAGVMALAHDLATHDKLDPLRDPTDPAKSVRVTFSRSFEKLAEPLRVAFAALGLPAGNDWPREVIEGMLTGALDGVDEAPTPGEALKQLAARSLLTLVSEPTPAEAEDAAPTRRVRLHPLLREYAGEQWKRLPNARRTVTLAALMVAVADFTQAHAEPTATAFAILAREELLIAGTIRAAAEAHVAPQALIAAVGGLSSYIDTGSHWRLGEYLRLWQLGARREVGDRAGEGTTLNNLGLTALLRGHTDEAARYYAEALAIAREVGDRAGEGTTLSNLGTLENNQGHMEEAARYFEQALAILREVGDRTGEGATLSNLGVLAQRRERVEEAAHYYAEALAIRREVGDRAGEGYTLGNLGALEELLGHLMQAQDYYQQAAVIFDEIGAEQNVRTIREAIARVTTARVAAAPSPQLSAPSDVPPTLSAEAPSIEEPVAVGGGGKRRRGWWPFGRRR